MSKETDVRTQILPKWRLRSVKRNDKAQLYEIERKQMTWKVQCRTVRTAD